MNKFKRLWEAPGLATIDADDGDVRVIIFDRKAREARLTARGDALQSRDYRNQAYAPLRELPVTTISIYTGGPATARKLGQPLPPAGYGFVAVTGGSGHRHNGGRELHRQCGQITTSTANVRTPPPTWRTSWRSHS